MGLRTVGAEQRNAAIRAETQLDNTEIPVAKADAASLLDTMQAIIDAQTAVLDAVQPILDASAQALADMDVIITGYDTATAAQQRGMIKDLARAHKDRIRDIKICAQQIKGHVSKIKDMARGIKRTIRLVT